MTAPAIHAADVQLAFSDHVAVYVRGERVFIGTTHGALERVCDLLGIETDGYYSDDDMPERMTERCPHCGEDLDDVTGTCPTCELTRDAYGLTLDQAQRVGVAIKGGMTEDEAVRRVFVGRLAS